MKAPPKTRFAEWDILTAEDRAKGRALQAELSRLDRVAEGYSPRQWKRTQRTAKASANAEPSEDAMHTLGSSFKLGSPFDRQSIREFRQLRAVARATAWKFHREQVGPFLREVFGRALAAVENEESQRAAREQEWEATLATGRAWFQYYGLGLQSPDVGAALARRGLLLRTELDRATADPGALAAVSDPPAIHPRFLTAAD